MKLLSLFSGIGAFEKALTEIEVEYDLLNYCEIDKFASKSYSTLHNVDESLNLGDITKIDATKLDDFDILTHGSPCQSFSLAGKQEGGDEGSETKSSLMWYTVKIIKEKKPKYVIWENVKNILSKKHVHNFNKYIEELDKLEYTSFYKVLNAKNFNSPQNRERVFCISILDCKEDYIFPEPVELKYRLKDILEENVEERYFLSNKTVQTLIRHNNKVIKNVLPDVSSTICAGYYKMGGRDQQYIGEPKISIAGELSNINYGQSKRVLTINGICNTLGATSHPPKILIAGELSNTKYSQLNRVLDTNGICSTLDTMQGGNRQPKILLDYRIRKLTPLECLRLQGFSNLDYIKIKEANISNSQCYKQAGNSINVNVLKAIFTNLFKKE